MTAATAALRPTTAAIDLAALRHNLFQVRRLAGSRDVIAVVKADAYGHGAVAISRALTAEGVTRFGVALVEEARALREAGIRGELLVLGGFTADQASEMIDLGLTATVFHLAHAAALSEAARRAGRVVPVHAKIDTGMGRLGFQVDEAPEAIANLARLAGLRLDGVMTHFADADLADPAFAREQMARFDRVIAVLAARGIAVGLRHAANSAAVMAVSRDGVAGLEAALYDAVRPGIMLYGCRPGPSVGPAVDLRPVLSLTTRIGLLKRVPSGTPISYGRTFVTRRPSLIAILPIGYADGYPRALSNVGAVVVRGRRAPVTGRVCMDLTMADVTDVPGVSEGDDVAVIGTQGDTSISAEDAAAAAGTIAYELLCGIGPRVPRRYLDREA
ncbi:MAG: alanine racemase [Nitrospirae bacterium]|nr:alanine racemase [Nitrospirota bacterium]